MRTGDDPSAELFRDVVVARQPILDTGLRTVGYELLYRDVDGTWPQSFDGRAATATIVTDVLLGMGHAVVAGDRDAYLNVPAEDLLAGSLLGRLPSDGIVIEVLEDATDDDATRTALRAHRAAGFRLALDDLVPGDRRTGLIDEVDVVKVDLQLSGQPAATRFIRTLARAGHTVLAEKVETRPEHRAVVAAGASLVQGYFFTRPELIRGSTPVGSSGANVALLELLAHEYDVDVVADLIGQDLALTHRFLRVMERQTGWRGVESLRHGLVVVGQRAIRRIAALSLLEGLAAQTAPELATVGGHRARACELLEIARGGDDLLGAFCAGMFSVLGAGGVLEPALVAQLPVPDSARSALLGTDGGVRGLLETQLAIEAGDWGAGGASARAAGIPVTAIGAANAEAARWADRLTAVAGTG